MTNTEKLYLDAYNYNPIQYKAKITEELTELSLAWQHYLDGKETSSGLLKELADVYVQLEKIEVYLEHVMDVKGLDSYLSTMHEDINNGIRLDIKNKNTQF